MEDWNYDLAGKNQRQVRPYSCKDGGNLQIKNPYCIDLFNDEKIFVSDLDEKSNTSTVYCLESSGNILYPVSNPSLKQCLGITVDENKNVLVCDWLSHKVILITRDGKDVREFLTEKDGLYQPYTTSFRFSDGTLVVTCRYRNDILVFTLK